MKDILRYILQFIRPYKKRLLLILIVLVGITATTLVEPFVYKLIIDVLVSSFSTEGGSVSLLLTYLGFWGATSLVGLLLFTLYRYTIDMMSLSIYQDFMVYAFNKVVRFDVRQHLEKKSGEMIKRIDNAADALFWVIFDFCISFLPSWFSFIAIMAFSFFFHWQMTLIAMLLIPLYVAIFIFGSVRTSKKQQISNDKMNAAIGRAYDIVTNIQVVKSFAHEQRETGLFERMVQEAMLFQKKVSYFWSMLGTAEFFLRILSRFVIFGGGIYFISQGSLSVGGMIMFLAFSGYIYAPLQVLGSQIQGIQRRGIDIKKVKALLEQIPEVLDDPFAKDLVVQRGNVLFDHVTFYYTQGKSMLRDITCSFPAGKITALVGHSGAGKTTIASLLNRFYDLSDGVITIDGKDIRHVTQKSLRKNIGMIMQENTMFNDTIFNNIHYGNPQASKKEVIEAAKKANIHRFIMSLPCQYESKVGERGLKLSGGEKQRIAIARVILKNPPILILDEATSALDSKTEQQIQEALEKIMKGRTTLVIAHRLSTVRKADQIIVLQKGKIIQVGSHVELMKQEGVYRDLVDLQVKGFLAK